MRVYYVVLQPQDKHEFFQLFGDDGKIRIIQEQIQKSWTQVQQLIQQDLEFCNLIDLWEDHTTCDIALGFVLYNLRVIRNFEIIVAVFKKNWG